MKDTFGGREWMFILIAIGTVDRDVVELVNAENKRRKDANEGQPPRQQKRADRADQRFRGSGHKKTNAQTFSSVL